MENNNKSEEIEFSDVDKIDHSKEASSSQDIEDTPGSESSHIQSSKSGDKDPHQNHSHFL